MLGRAVFLVDKNDILRHVEYVKEIDDQPDFAALLDATRKLTFCAIRKFLTPSNLL